MSGNCSEAGFICCIEESIPPQTYVENSVLTRDMFLKVAGNNTRNRALYFYFVESLADAQIKSKYQIAAYLAQLIGETDYFKAIESVQTEDDFNPLIGNNQTGDGAKFRGRGGILIRGRANYNLASNSIKGQL